MRFGVRLGPELAFESGRNTHLQQYRKKSNKVLVAAAGAAIAASVWAYKITRGK